MGHRHSADTAFAVGGRTYEMDDVDGGHPLVYIEVLCSICMAVSPYVATSLMAECAIS
jgi:hypothetical protein